MPHRAFNFVSPQDIVVVANDIWVDDEVSDNGVTDLAPGEDTVVAKIESTEPGIVLGVRAIGMTQHPHDFDNDGTSEHAILYHYEHKKKKGDGWNSLPGLTTTLPLGSIASPLGVVGGAYIGPLSAFRIRFENRTKGEANPKTIVAKDMGAEIHARVFRHGIPEA